MCCFSCCLKGFFIFGNISWEFLFLSWLSCWKINCFCWWMFRSFCFSVVCCFGVMKWCGLLVGGGDCLWGGSGLFRLLILFGLNLRLEWLSFCFCVFFWSFFFNVWICNFNLWRVGFWIFLFFFVIFGGMFLNVVGFGGLFLKNFLLFILFFRGIFGFIFLLFGLFFIFICMVCKLVMNFFFFFLFIIVFLFLVSLVKVF